MNSSSVCYVTFLVYLLTKRIGVSALYGGVFRQESAQKSRLLLTAKKSNPHVILRTFENMCDNSELEAVWLRWVLLTESEKRKL